MLNFFKKISIYKLRNLIGLKPSFFNINNTELNTSISDGFFWRTDNGYVTTFRFMDLTSFFYNKKSSIEIIFFDKNNKFLKKVIKKINLNNELRIDSQLLDNLEDYGVFYVFHKINKKLDSCIRQSCYTGFSFNNNIPSFVHGNTPATLKKINSKNEKIYFGLGGKHLFLTKQYKVQNYLTADNTEILILNPCSSPIKVEVNNNFFILNKGCSKLIKLKDSKTIVIKSKCYLLRPIIFDYFDSFLDVYHG